MIDRYIFSVFDRKAKSYGPLFEGNDVDQESIKFVREILILRDRDSDNPVAMFPQDFELRCVGVFQSDTGLIVSHDPEPVAFGSDVLQEV